MGEWIFTSSVLIVCILVLRCLFRGRISLKTQYSLWLLVALRLLVPFTFFESSISILNLSQQGREWLTRMGGSFFDADLSAYDEVISEEGQSDAFKDTRGADVQEAENSEDGAARFGQASDAESASDLGGDFILYPDSGAESELKEIGLSGAEDTNGEAVWVFSSARLFTGVWLSGIFLCAGMVIWSNFLFYRRLRCSRSLVKTFRTGCRLPVYVSDAVCAPCLFGVVRPSIYLTLEAAADEKAMRHILLHESVHYRHRDHLWVFVRMMCLCVHWYHPLVWLAAFLSRQDCELACDEAVLKNRKSEERIDYGRTLLAFAVSASESGFAGRLQCSTSISGGKKQLKERILLAALPSDQRGRRLLPSLLALLAAFATFTGGLEVQAVNDRETEDFKNIPILDVFGAAKEFTENEEQVWDASGSGRILADLNFDGYEDFCMQVDWEGEEDLYYCYLWNPEKGRFEQKGIVPRLQVEEETKLLVDAETDENGLYRARYYRFDEEGCLHLVRYVEEDASEEAVFSHLDLVCCEVSYSIPFLYHRELTEDMEQTEGWVYWAKKALTELYEWSGTKVDTVCFAVTEFGDFHFGGSQSDLQASRVFYSRCYGSRAGFIDCIENMNLVTERVVWYSDVTQWRVPENLKTMTDQEVAAWYFERSAFAEGEKLKTIEESYENAYVVCTESDHYYELDLNPSTREITSVYGPYEHYPMH